MILKPTLLTASALLFLAGCATNQDTSFAERSETIELSGTVEAVDLASRTFKVRDGNTSVTFKAGPQVQNLAQLEPGDRIILDYYESVAVGLADPADPGTAIGDVLVGTAAPGEKPGGGAIGSVTGVVEFLSYDSSTSVASLRLQDGTVEQVVVQPEMKDFAAARQPGDRIVVAIDRAVAVTVTEQD